MSQESARRVRLLRLLVAINVLIAVAAFVVVAQPPVTRIIECIGRSLSEPPCSPTEVRGQGMGDIGLAVLAFVLFLLPTIVGWWMVRHPRQAE